MNKQPSNLLLFFLLFLRINTLGRFNQRAFFCVNFSVKFREYYFVLYWKSCEQTMIIWSIILRVYEHLTDWSAKLFGLFGQIFCIFVGNLMLFFNLKFPIEKCRSKISSSTFSIKNIQFKIFNRKFLF